LKRPLTIGLLLAIGLLLFSNWRTAKMLEKEHALRMDAIFTVEEAIGRCQPAIFVKNNDPVNAVAAMKYRDAQNGHACVFLKDGRYGDLWWSIIVENKGEKAHLEWNFNERGKYKWGL
jgi:hypothetical protein